MFWVTFAIHNPGQDLAGIQDDFPVGPLCRDEDLADSSQEKSISLALSKTWQTLATDGPNAEREIGSKIVEQEQFARAVKALTAEEKEQVMGFEQEARRIVRAKISLIEETERKQAMTDEIKTAFAKAGVKPDEGELLVAYDQKSAGEPITSPHVRYPPLRAERLKKMVNHTLEALAVDFIPASVTFAVMDAGALGNKGVPCWQR